MHDIEWKYIDVYPDILFKSVFKKSNCVNAPVWQSGNKMIRKQF